MTDGDLANRLYILESMEAIRALKAHYARLADSKYSADQRRQPQEILDGIAWEQTCCFTEQAVFDTGKEFGSVLRGRDALYEWFRGGPWDFTLHYYQSPNIEVHGDTARAGWSLWQVGTLTAGRRAVFLAATTHETYQRTDSGWLHTEVSFQLRFMTPFAGKGWAEEPTLR